MVCSCIRRLCGVMSARCAWSTMYSLNEASARRSIAVGLTTPACPPVSTVSIQLSRVVVSFKRTSSPSSNQSPRSRPRILLVPVTAPSAAAKLGVVLLLRLLRSAASPGPPARTMWASVSPKPGTWLASQPSKMARPMVWYALGSCSCSCPPVGDVWRGAIAAGSALRALGSRRARRRGRESDICVGLGRVRGG